MVLKYNIYNEKRFKMISLKNTSYRFPGLATFTAALQKQMIHPSASHRQSLLVRASFESPFLWALVSSTCLNIPIFPSPKCLNPLGKGAIHHTILMMNQSEFNALLPAQMVSEMMTDIGQKRKKI
jgi:hypothetical protein